MTILKGYHGWLNIDKPKGLSSARVVTMIKRLLKIKKAGHAGTLDPFATGVLPIAIGEATKTVNFVQNELKEYSFVVKFGIETDTYDETGVITDTSQVLPTQKELKHALTGFIGLSLQVPPAYSAIKVNGKRAYTLARAGKAQTLPAREIEIKSLVLEEFDGKEAKLKVCCSKGTYIRSLAYDIAKKLGTCGHVKALRRLKVGLFDESNLIPIEKIKEMIYNHSIEKVVLPICEVLRHVLSFCCSCEQESQILQGRTVKLINQHHLCSTAAQQRIYNQKFVLARSEKKPISIGITDGQYFKPIRVFNL